jgi:hypothetical protein
MRTCYGLGIYLPAWRYTYGGVCEFVLEPLFFLDAVQNGVARLNAEPLTFLIVILFLIVNFFENFPRTFLFHPQKSVSFF